MPKIGEEKENNERVSHCEFSWCNGKCHWILMRDDGGAVMLDEDGKPFWTKADAMAFVRMHNVSGYRIEHRQNSVQSRND